MCVDVIGPYTLKGKDGTEIDFICLTMIDPASSWLEIIVVELPIATDAVIPMDTKGAPRHISTLSYHTLTNHLQ